MYLPNTAVSCIHYCTVLYMETHTQPFMPFRPMVFCKKHVRFFRMGTYISVILWLEDIHKASRKLPKKNCSVLSSQTWLMLLPLKHVFVIGKTAVCPVFPGYYGFFPFSGSVLSFPISKHISMPNFSQLAWSMKEWTCDKGKNPFALYV